MAAAWFVGLCSSTAIWFLTHDAPISIVGGSICCLIWYFMRKEQ